MTKRFFWGRARISWLCVAALLLASSLWAQDLVAVPTLSSHVVDVSGTLSAPQQQALNDKLTAFEASSGSQVVVLLVPSTAPEDIASYANRVGSTWKIGRKDIGDGLLLIVAKNDRKLRIEVARTLEGAIPDLAAKRIIDLAISPRFKQGDFAGGIDAGLNQITALIQGEALPAVDDKAASGKQGFQWMDLAVFMFFAVAVGGSVARRALGNKLGSLAVGGAAGFIAMTITASLLIAVLAGVAAVMLTLLSSLNKVSASGGGRGPWGGSGSGGGWSSGSGGGGGFGSGGGGSFGGGGASGGW